MCCTRADGGVLGSSLVSAVFILGVLWRGVVGCSACGGQGPGFESRQCSVHTRRVVARRGGVQRVRRQGPGFESRQGSVRTRRVVARRGGVQRVRRPGSGVRASSVQGTS